MKHIGKKRARAVLLAAALVATLFLCEPNSWQAVAGSSDHVIDKESFAKQIDATKWSVPNEDVSVVKGKIQFDKDSTADTKIITVDAAKKSEYHPELFRAEYTFTLHYIPKGKKFIAAFSLAGIESSPEEAGNLEVVFEDKNGIQTSLIAYDENGEKVMLAKPQNCGIRLGAVIKVRVNATTDNKISIVVNGKELYKDIAPIELEGRIGFLQSGGCQATIEDVMIVSHSYDRPENTNIVEDFESGTINANTLVSRMISGQQYYPTGIHVEEYNGSNVLMFKNVNAGYFGTRHQYSNFEVSFDVPFMLHENEINEDGHVTSAKHTAFVLGIGDDSVDYTGHGYTSSAKGICFTTNRVYALDSGATNFADLTDKNYFDIDKNEGYSVKVSVVDTQVVVSMKSLQAKKYEEVLKYKLGNTMPMGYIHIFTNGQSYFAIDNFKVLNKDKEANVVEVEYKDSFLKKTQDWEYEPVKAEYKNVSDQAREFSWNIVPIIAGGVGVLCIVLAIIIVKCGKKPQKKEEISDEK